jgi:ribosome assembly protein 4
MAKYNDNAIFFIRNGESRNLASCSKDQTIRIWDVVLGQTVRILNGHTAAISCIRWGGSGLIYSASRDRTIKVWRASDVSIRICIFNFD